MQGPRLLVALDVDASAFTPPAEGLDLTLAGGLGLSISTSALGTTLPDVTASVGIAGAGALRLRVGPTPAAPETPSASRCRSRRPAVRRFICCRADPAWRVWPMPLPPARSRRCPRCSTRSPDSNPAGAPANAGEIAGRIIARLGDALALRTGAPARFDQAALVAFGNDPAAALAARAASLGAAGLTLLTEAVGPLLGGVRDAIRHDVGGALVVDARTGNACAGGQARRASKRPSRCPACRASSTSRPTSPWDRPAWRCSTSRSVPAVARCGVLTLAPFARVAAGASAREGQHRRSRARRRYDDAVSPFRWNLGDSAGRPVAIDVGATPADITESQDPAAVAIAVVGAVLDLAGGVVLAVAASPDRARPGGARHRRRAACSMACCSRPGAPIGSIPRSRASSRIPVLLLRRVARLAGNLAAAPDAAIPIDGHAHRPQITQRDDGGDAGVRPQRRGRRIVGAQPEQRRRRQPRRRRDVDSVPPGGTVPEGLTVELIDLPAAGSAAAAPRS